MQLQIHSVSKHYKQDKTSPTALLDNIDITIKKGQIVSLIGPAGCGKSTLLAIIAELQKPTSGAIYLGKEKVTKPSPNKGVVFQEPALFPWLNVRENVMFPLRKRTGKK